MIMPFLFQIKKRQSLYTIESKHGRNLYSRYLILIIFFCIFDKTSGDYFHYKEYVSELIKYNENYSGLEDIYFYLIKVVGGSYFLFRFIVWGSAVLIFFKCTQLLEIDKSISIFIFLLIVLLNFSYARVSLAIVIFILGYIILCSNYRKKKINIFWGILLIVSSLFFHKSIYVLVPIALVSFVPFNRKTIMAAIVVFPIFIYLINYFIGDFIFLLEDGSSELNYLNQDRTDAGIAEIIETCLLFGPIIYFVYNLLYNCYIRKRINLPYEINQLVVFTFYVLYVSFVLYFLDIGSNAIYYRIRNMAIIPISFVVAYYISKTRLNRFSFVAIVLLYIYNFYHMFYMYYLKTLGLGI